MRPRRPLLSPPDVECRQFITEWLTLRLRSALMALSGAASSGTTAPMLAPIAEHRPLILRSSCAPQSSKKGAGRPHPKPSAARATQGVVRCGKTSNDTFAIDWNSLCYGLSNKLGRSTPPCAVQQKNAAKTKLSAP